MTVRGSSEAMKVARFGAQCRRHQCCNFAQGKWQSQVNHSSGHGAVRSAGLPVEGCLPPGVALHVLGACWPCGRVLYSQRLVHLHRSGGCLVYRWSRRFSAPVFLCPGFKTTVPRSPPCTAPHISGATCPIRSQLYFECLLARGWWGLWASLFSAANSIGPSTVFVTLCAGCLPCSPQTPAPPSPLPPLSNVPHEADGTWLARHMKSLVRSRVLHCGQPGPQVSGPRTMEHCNDPAAWRGPGSKVLAGACGTPLCFAGARVGSYVVCPRGTWRHDVVSDVALCFVVARARVLG